MRRVRFAALLLAALWSLAPAAPGRAAPACAVSCLAQEPGSPGGVPDVVQLPRSPATAGHLLAVAAGPAAAGGLAVLPGSRLLDQDGDAAVLAWVRNDADGPRSTALTALLVDAGGAVLGQARGPLTDIQAGQTKLAELSSLVPAAAVAALRFRFDPVLPGSITPALLTLGPVRADPADATALLVAVYNADSAAHSGFISIPLIDAAGALVGVAFGPYDALGPGQAATIRCTSPLGPIPPGTRPLPQVDSAT